MIFHLFRRLILWFRKTSYILPKVKYLVKKLLAKTLSKKKPIVFTPVSKKKSAKAGLPEEKLHEKDKPSEEKEPSGEEEPKEEKPPTTEPPQIEYPAKKKAKTKTQKPSIVKTPIEKRVKKKEGRKSLENKKKKATSKRIEEIDLGRSKRKRISLTEQPVIVNSERINKASEGKETLTRIESPFIEIDLNEVKVFLVLPKQQFKSSAESDIPQQLEYKLELDGEEQTIFTKVSMDNQGTIEIEEKRIELVKSLKSFQVVLPDELQDRTYKTYSYYHSNKNLYVFVAIGNNWGRMKYLYDADGNINPIPHRMVWLLIHEDFKLEIKSNYLPEETWIWEQYRPFRVNLKEMNELIIKNTKTSKEYKFPCEPTFSIEGQLIEDDFKDQMPLLMGETVKIKAPRENPCGWAVWIQNKIAGYRIITENWSGVEPLSLKLPDDLPCECGEFQVDICEQEDRIPIETLFFRYIHFLQLKFPRELVIPNPSIGHNQEIITILLGRDFQDWELILDGEVHHKHIDSGYQVELSPQQDIFHFSFIKKGKPETEASIKITIPRLKWRTSKNKKWYDKPLQIKRDELIAGTDFYLTVCTNDFDTKYDLSAILDTNDQRLQEAKFIQKGIICTLSLNQFYDTIKKNKGAVTLRIEIRSPKENQLLHELKILSVNPPILRCKLCGFESYDEEDIISHIEEFHLSNFIESLTLEEMRKYISNLPIAIYKCYYCGFYVREDDPTNPNSSICSHIEKDCPKVDRSKCPTKIHFCAISNIDEIIENVIPGLPNFYKCKLCGVHFKEQNKREQVKHFLEKHEDKLLFYK